MKTDIGKRIRQARLMRNLSQENVAEAIGMSPGNFGKIERGEVALSIDNLQRIAFHLDLPLSSLIQDNQASEHSPDYLPIEKPELSRIYEHTRQMKLEIEQLKIQLQQMQSEIKKLSSAKK